MSKPQNLRSQHPPQQLAHTKQHKMTQKDAARIQSKTALKQGGQVHPDDFAARAQRAADRRVKRSDD